MHLMDYLGSDLSVPLKTTMSDPISGGRGGSWVSVLSSILVG